MSITTLLNDHCSRCGLMTETLHPYRLSEVVYRGKPIPYPWLCLKCIMTEKRKAWKATQP